MASRKALRRAQEQAQLETFIRVNPEASALAAAIRGERSSFISTARSARGAAQGIRALTRSSRPQVAGAFHDAQLTRRSAQEVLDQHLAALGPAALDYQAASARENAGFRTRIGEAEAHALADLDARSHNAVAGAVYAESAARNRYLTDKGELQRRQRELGREAGAITQASMNTALEQDAKERQARRAYKLQASALEETGRHHRAQEGTAQQNADTAADKKNAQGRKDAAARRRKGRYSADAQRSATGYVSYARTYAQDARKIGYNRHEAARLLLRGAPLKGKDAKGKETTVTPGRQAYDERLASVALDLAYDGHVSKANQAWLRKKGISPRSQGWPTAPRAGRSRVSGVASSVAAGASRFR